MGNTARPVDIESVLSQVQSALVASIAGGNLRLVCVEGLSASPHIRNLSHRAQWDVTVTVRDIADAVVPEVMSALREALNVPVIDEDISRAYDRG